MTSHFEHRKQQLLSFIESTGHFPDATRDPAEKQLEEWVLAQRRRYSRLAENYRSLDGWVQELEAVPGWEWGSTWTPEEETEESPWAQGARRSAAIPSSSWRSSYIRVRAFSTENHRLPKAEDELSLAGWIRRHQLLQRAGGLDAHRKELLEAAPFWSWDSELQPCDSRRPPRPQWLASYNRVVDFVEENGHLPRYEDDRMLRPWVVAYVRKYHRDELNLGKRELLDLIPAELTI